MTPLLLALLLTQNPAHGSAPVGGSRGGSAPAHASSHHASAPVSHGGGVSSGSRSGGGRSRSVGFVAGVGSDRGSSSRPFRGSGASTDESWDDSVDSDTDVIDNGDSGDIFDDDAEAADGFSSSSDDAQSSDSDTDTQANDDNSAVPAQPAPQLTPPGAPVNSGDTGSPAIWRWNDSQGNVHYTDDADIPDGARASAVLVAPGTAPDAPTSAH